MGHYDTSRDGYCGACGAAPGNFINGVCGICNPPRTLTKSFSKLQRQRAEDRRNAGFKMPPLTGRVGRDKAPRRSSWPPSEAYTVILKRPDKISEAYDESPRVTDVYVARVHASNAPDALRYAREEVRGADLEDAQDDAQAGTFLTIEPKDYVMLALFKGHPELVAHGDITGWWN